MTSSLVPFVVVTLFTLVLLEVAAKWARDNRSYRAVLHSRLLDLAFYDRAQPEAALFRNQTRWPGGIQQARMLKSHLQKLIEQAALSTTPRAIMITCLLIGAGTGSCIFALASWRLLPITLAAMSGPLLYLLHRRRIRRLKLTKQLPAVFQTMSRTVRAGHTIRGAMQNIADTFDQPVAYEFARCCDQQALGASRDQALRALGERTQIAELKLFATALVIQNRTGGDVVRLFGNLAEMVRKRQRFQERVRTLTGEARMQAIVLVILPIAAFLGLKQTSPDYVQVLIQHPAILCSAATAQLVGGLWIYKIIRIDV